MGKLTHQAEQLRLAVLTQLTEAGRSYKASDPDRRTRLQQAKDNLGFINRLVQNDTPLSEFLRQQREVIPYIWKPFSLASILGGSPPGSLYVDHDGVHFTSWHYSEVPKDGALFDPDLLYGFWIRGERGGVLRGLARLNPPQALSKISRQL